MLSEGWDARTVTHVLGVRAFGTQLLCEQIVGRALRRQSYDANEETGLFNVEYADVLGIPFDFTGKPVIAEPQAPPKPVHVKAVIPERDACEIRFPRVLGYQIELPEDRLTANFRRGFHDDPDAGTGRRHGHTERGNHRRGRRPDARAHEPAAAQYGAVPPDEAPSGDPVPRSQRRPQALPVRSTQAPRPPLDRAPPRLRRRHLPRATAIP